MIPRPCLVALLALPLLVSPVQARQAGANPDDGGALAAAAPLTLPGVEALVGRSLGSLERAPLVCGALRPDGSKACRVARRYGDYVIDTPAPLTAKVRLRRLTLIVRGQTVEAVSLETSPDNFHAVTHLLKARFGTPVGSRNTRVRLARDVQARLTMSWRANDLVVSLTDPTPSQALSVRIGSEAPHPDRANGA